MSRQIYVGNLPQSITEIGLEAPFREYGNVTSVRLITDRGTGQNLGFGFVEMQTAAEARRAVQELHGIECDGRRLTVQVALPKT